jgi:hypothetical protein
MYRREEMYTWLWWGNMKERDHLENTDLDGRIILKLIFWKWDGGMDRLDLARDRDRWRALVNAAMNLRGSIKCGEFLNYHRTCKLLKKNSAPLSQSDFHKNISDF